MIPFVFLPHSFLKLMSSKWTLSSCIVLWISLCLLANHLSNIIEVSVQDFAKFLIGMFVVFVLWKCFSSQNLGCHLFLGLVLFYGFRFHTVFSHMFTFRPEFIWVLHKIGGLGWSILFVLFLTRLWVFLAPGWKDYSFAT